MVSKPESLEMRASSKYIAKIIYTISGRFLADVENFIEICKEVALIDEGSTSCFNQH